MHPLLASILPYFGCLGWQRKATNAASQDPLCSILHDGKYRINGCPGFRRHYIKRQVGDSYKIVRQVSMCDFNEGGQTFTTFWTETFNIEERKLRKSERGRELLEDYDICKRPNR
ncbi:hypothetical protein BDV38DRAFT_257238 [Aspergillus pseudotamarii]|uniref:Uncharacterized protein n=2 Tax=Aspergillus subgen. Circumdati TaxID=2720871 RepID=A0A5N6SGQ4_ASPPS|nr:uncharacterized protein BDV38DRAFT_257238 [Aspergillus pseudotamarii]XP_031934920.1 uncharacterized protein BDV37DRAFT_265382 [Aspergillus pseudonomiae]KAE8133852.1 hypothetical protein BDV38DRAFT_257238 [Aspergillus pseudotamarii]KAE8397601.1 hypothetical protein BDV37DRAFT_265382 [Aspergillus pseudonomiae]